MRESAYGEGARREAPIQHHRRSVVRASVQGLIGFVTDLVASPRFRAGMAILVDHLLLDARPLTAADIKALAVAVVRLDDQIGPSRVAIVVPDPLTFGFARMYELYAEPAQVRSRVFYSRNEALEWLGSGDEPAEQAGAAPRA